MQLLMRALLICCAIMQRAAEAFQFLCDSECLSEHDKEAYKKLLDSNMSEAVFCSGTKKAVGIAGESITAQK